MDSVPKLKRFLEIARRFHPVNLGDARYGGALRPSRSMNPLSHWNRDIRPDFDQVIAGLDTTTTAAAVFDNRAAAEDFVKAVKEANLGLSINISTSIEGAEHCCHEAGLCRHSVGYSLGFEGKTEHLPNEDRSQTCDDVRPRYGKRITRQEDDRLGKGRPADPGAGCIVSGSFLLLRSI